MYVWWNFDKLPSSRPQKYSIVLANAIINTKDQPSGQIHNYLFIHFKNRVWPGIRLDLLTCNASWKGNPKAFSLIGNMRAPKRSTEATSNY